MTAARKMKAPARIPTPWQTAWSGLLDVARDIYRQEIERLATDLRPRILAGEFSDCEDEGRGDPRYMRLENEIEATHAWGDVNQGAAPLVRAISTWPEREGRMCKAAKVSGGGQLSPECIAHDVMAVAAERGWVEPLRSVTEEHPYRLRVAK